MKSRHAALAIALLLVACESSPPRPCTIRTAPDGASELLCPDGSRAPIGASCSIDGSPPTPVLVCGDARAQLPAGCSIEDRADGTRWLHCPGGDALLSPAATGALYGVVERIGETDGAGVRVALEGTPHVTTTDASGAYRLEVPLGTYTATFTAPGFGEERLPAVWIDAGGRRLDLLLRRSTRIGGEVTQVFDANEKAAAVLLDGVMTVVRAGEDAAVTLGQASYQSSARLSPDGAALLRGSVVTLLNTRGEMQLPEACRNPSFSPDGSRLACVLREELLVFALDGSPPIDVGALIGEDAFLWKGASLLAGGKDGTRLLPAGGTTAVPLSDEVCEYFVDLGGDLALCGGLVVDVSARTVARLDMSPYPESVRLDPRGWFVAFSAYVSGSTCQVLDLRSSTTTRVASGWPAAFSPDGGWLACSGSNEGLTVTNLETFAELSSPEATFVAFTPDSTAVVLGAGDGSLQVIELATEERTTIDPGPVAGSAWLEERFAHVSLGGYWTLIDLETFARKPVPGPMSELAGGGSVALFTPYYGAPLLVELPSMREAPLPAGAWRTTFTPSAEEVVFYTALAGGTQLQIYERRTGKVRAADRGQLTPIVLLEDRIVYARRPALDEDPATPGGVFWTRVR